MKGVITSPSKKTEIAISLPIGFGIFRSNSSCAYEYWSAKSNLPRSIFSPVILKGSGNFANRSVLKYPQILSTLVKYPFLGQAQNLPSDDTANHMSTLQRNTAHCTDPINYWYSWCQSLSNIFESSSSG